MTENDSSHWTHQEKVLWHTFFSTESEGGRAAIQGKTKQTKSISLWSMDIDLIGSLLSFDFLRGKQRAASISMLFNSDTSWTCVWKWWEPPFLSPDTKPSSINHSRHVLHSMSVCYCSFMLHVSGMARNHLHNIPVFFFFFTVGCRASVSPRVCNSHRLRHYACYVLLTLSLFSNTPTCSFIAGCWSFHGGVCFEIIYQFGWKYTLRKTRKIRTLAQC